MTAGQPKRHSPRNHGLWRVCDISGSRVRIGDGRGREEDYSRPPGRRSWSPTAGRWGQRVPAHYLAIFDQAHRAWQRHSGRAMSFSDAIGFVAAALVLVTFYQRQMIPLRLAALGSNLAFIVYGLALGLAPVWLLHALLLPVNASRLAEALRAKHSLDASPR